MSRSLFLITVERAAEYRLASILSLERIAQQLMERDMFKTPYIPPPEGYENRESYQQGRFSQEEDLGRYRKLMEEQEDG